MMNISNNILKDNLEEHVAYLKIGSTTLSIASSCYGSKVYVRNGKNAEISFSDYCLISKSNSKSDRTHI